MLLCVVEINLCLLAGALKLACEAVAMIALKGEEEYRYSMLSHFYRTVLEVGVHMRMYVHVMYARVRVRAYVRACMCAC